MGGRIIQIWRKKITNIHVRKNTQEKEDQDQEIEDVGIADLTRDHILQEETGIRGEKT